MILFALIIRPQAAISRSTETHVAVDHPLNLPAFICTDAPALKAVSRELCGSCA